MTKKEHIYKAASFLFHQKGFAGTSVRDIASAVNLEASSLYSHIKSKHQLLEAICSEVSKAFERFMQEINESEDRPIKKIERICYFHIEMALENPYAVTVFNDEWYHLKDEAYKRLKDSRKAYEQNVIDIIVDGMPGEIRTTLDPAIFVKSFLTSFYWMYKSKSLKNNEQMDTFKQSVWHIWSATLVPEDKETGK